MKSVFIFRIIIVIVMISVFVGVEYTNLLIEENKKTKGENRLLNSEKDLLSTRLDDKNFQFVKSQTEKSQIQKELEEQISNLKNQISNNQKIIDGLRLREAQYEKQLTKEVNIKTWKIYKDQYLGISYLLPPEWREIDPIVRDKDSNSKEFTDLSVEEEREILYPYNPDRTLEVYKINNHFIKISFFKNVKDIDKDIKEHEEEPLLQEVLNFNKQKWLYSEYEPGYAELYSNSLISVIQLKENSGAINLGFTTDNSAEILFFKVILKKIAESLKVL